MGITTPNNTLIVPTVSEIDTSRPISGNRNITLSLLSKGAMVKIAVITMSQTTCYSFGGILYRQVSGAGIGLRGSACLAKITMGQWDQAWAEVMMSWGIKCKIFMRYIDDLRIYVYPLKPGWSWTQNGWVFDSTETNHECGFQKMCDEFCKSFNSIMDFLEFITESEDDFTLDFCLPWTCRLG